MEARTNRRIIGFHELRQYARLFHFENLLRNLPFLLFISLLAGIYIWNIHSSDRHLREMELLRNELNELNWELTNLRSELNTLTKQSHISLMVEPLGLQDLTEPPRKIVRPNE